MVFTYHHKIYLSVKPEAAGCNKINDTIHYCYSLIPMLDLLSDYNGSTDVFHTVRSLHSKYVIHSERLEQYPNKVKY